MGKGFALLIVWHRIILQLVASLLIAVMKKTSILLLSVLCLPFCALLSHADPLDDLIDGMRVGVTFNEGQQARILKTTGAAASESYKDGIVSLYLWGIKASIVDPDHNGDWPYRSFLVDGNPSLRKHLNRALKERFEKKPDSILVYAAICPAIFGGDEERVDRLQSYLKEHDAFLFKLEQAQIDQYWRPYIKKALAKEAAGKK
ncbi:MAG: hypothetical protein ABSE59_01115 [Opitutaceae bacterium]|jgi:hypothetical protein